MVEKPFLIRPRKGPAQPVTRESKLFYFLMLAMYSGQLGTFSSISIYISIF